MQKNKILIPLITTFIFSLTACKKDRITEPPTTTTITLSADSNYLSKIYLLRGNGSTIDTVTNILIYDNLKRVSQYLEHHTYNLNGIITKLFDTTTYLYNSSELLPNKTIKQIISPSGIIDNITNFLTYSNNGILIRDSSISLYNSIIGNNNFWKKISTFNYTGNKIFITTINTSLNLPNTINIQKDTLTQDANSNIITKISFYDYGLNSPNNNSSITTCTYGNNQSPFINVNIYNKLGNFDINNYYLFQGSKNNLTSLNISNYSNGIFQGNVIIVDNFDTYSFKANGYPNSLNFQFPLNPQIRKLIYLYKTL